MIVAPLVMLAALVESPFRPVPPTEKVQVVGSIDKSTCAKRAMVSAGAEAQGIANLPFAFGRKFATLDSYLVHLECAAAPIDLPWWKQIGPGVYMQTSTATDAATETATRAELMRRFGFSR